MPRHRQKKESKKFPLFDKIILGLNIVAVICLLLSYMAPSTNPRDSVIIALLGFGILFLLAINLIFIIYWVFRKPALLIFSLLAIVFSYSAIKAQYGFSKATFTEQKPKETDIRVLQYNVRKFVGVGKYFEAPIQKEILQVIAENNPDIVNLEEFAKYRTNGDSISTQIKAALKSNYQFSKFYTVSRLKDSTGNTIFSRYPIIATGVIDTAEVLDTKAIFADLKINNDTVRVYCLHLASVQVQGKQKNKALKGSLNLGKSTFIQNRLSSAFISRSFQVDQIKKHISNCPYPFIITGDFNDTPQSYAVNELSDGLHNAFIEKGSGLQTTYYTKMPLQIDYILASKQFDVLSYKSPDLEISDHKPVISDLRLK